MSLLLAVMAVALQTHHDGWTPAVTREQAMSLPPRELRRIVLGQAGDLVREVSRPTFQGVPYPDERLQTLVFGLAPEAILPGLCNATAIYVAFASDAPAQETGRRPGWRVPVRVSHVSTEQVYKVIGDLDAPSAPPGSDARARDLAQCRNAPVVTAETLNFDQPRYFSVDGPLLPARAAGILQRVLADAAGGALSDLRCDPDSTDLAPCLDPRLVLRNVTLGQLTSVASAPSGPGRYILSASFSDPDNPNRQVILGVRAEVEVMEPSYRLVRIHGVAVKRSFILF